MVCEEVLMVCAEGRMVCVEIQTACVVVEGRMVCQWAEDIHHAPILTVKGPLGQTLE